MEFLNIGAGVVRKDKFLEAGIHLLRMFFHPSAVGTLNELEVSQLIRAYFKQLVCRNHRNPQQNRERSAE